MLVIESLIDDRGCTPIAFVYELLLHIYTYTTHHKSKVVSFCFRMFYVKYEFSNASLMDASLGMTNNTLLRSYLYMFLCQPLSLLV